MGEFTHFNNLGEAVMVDVSDKKETVREATARGKITMSPECLQKIMEGQNGKRRCTGSRQNCRDYGSKEDFGTDSPVSCAEPDKGGNGVLPGFERNAVFALCRVRTVGKTGVEMEALTGVSTALLTIYDMCKAVDKSMLIENICLIKKNRRKKAEHL